MKFRNATRWLGPLALLQLACPAPATDPTATSATKPADLATQAEGSYVGEVISDSRGSSRSDVRIRVIRIGPNRVRVTSDYERLPSFEASLSRYMQTIQNSGGDQVFLIDLAKIPISLDVTVDGASWSGRKEP